MEYGFLSRAGKFLQEQTKRRRWTMVFLCLAAGVTLGTVGFLKLYGQAMTHKVKMLECQYEVHVHTEDCYEENEDGEEVLVCGLADYVIHVHNDDCYDQKGNLVCTLEEHELHEHDDSCYEEEEVLICGEEEAEGSSRENAEDGTGEDAEAAADDGREAETGSGPEAETGKELACEKEEHKHDAGCYADGAGCEKEAHTHDDGCYETTETLTCSEEEHTHDDSCYSEGESELVCGESEHTHDDGCYDEDGNLTCEETEHEHDDSCYSEGGSELVCGKDEHTHGDGCYEVEETLVCETEEHEHDDSCAAESELACEIEEHEHDDSCYAETEAGTKEETASEPAKEAEAEEAAKTEEPAEDGEAAEDGHTHTDGCYETQEVLTCGELELHTHDADPESETCCYTEDCFDGEGNLIEGSRPSCGLLQLEEHIHTEECFRTVELTPEEIAALNGGATLHVHTDECYDEEGNLICGHEVTHLHQLECYDEDGNLICGFGGEQKPEHEKICEGSGYTVKVIYSDSANIPKDAELIVRQITEESDPEHYAQRQAEAREVLENENTSIHALFDIGFYVDGEEIEPEDTVNVTIQFLDDNGLPEGTPVKIVHFAESGSEVLGGGDVDSEGNATFETDSFSEFLLASAGGEIAVTRDTPESGRIEDHLTGAGISVNGNPYDGESLLNPGEQFTVDLVWQLEREELQNSKTYTYRLPEQIIVKDVKEEVLFDAENVRKGVYSVENGILTVTYDNVSDVNTTTFKLDAVWNQERLGSDTTVNWNDELSTKVYFDNSKIAATKELIGTVNQEDGSLVGEYQVRVKANLTAENITLTDTLTAEKIHFAEGYYQVGDKKYDYRIRKSNGSYEYGNFEIEDAFDEYGNAAGKKVTFPVFSLPDDGEYVVEYGVKLDADDRFTLDNNRTPTSLRNTATASYTENGSTISSTVTVEDVYRVEEKWIVKEMGDAEADTDIPWTVRVNTANSYNMSGSVIGDHILTEGVVYKKDPPITITGVDPDGGKTEYTPERVELADNMVDALAWTRNAIEAVFDSDDKSAKALLEAAVGVELTKENISDYIFVSESGNRFAWFAPQTEKPASYELHYYTDASDATGAVIANQASAGWKQWFAGENAGNFVQEIHIEKENSGVRQEGESYFVDWTITLDVPEDRKELKDICLYDILPSHENEEGVIFDWLQGLSQEELDYRRATDKEGQSAYLNDLTHDAFTFEVESRDSVLKEKVENALRSATTCLGNPLESLKKEDLRLYGSEQTGQLKVTEAEGTEYVGKYATATGFGIDLGTLPETTKNDGYTIQIRYTTQVAPGVIEELDGRDSGWNNAALFQKIEDSAVMLAKTGSGYWLDHVKVNHPLQKDIVDYDYDNRILTYRVTIDPRRDMKVTPNTDYILNDMLEAEDATYVEDSFTLSLIGDMSDDASLIWNPDASRIIWRSDVSVKEEDYGIELNQAAAVRNFVEFSVENPDSETNRSKFALTLIGGNEYWSPWDYKGPDEAKGKLVTLELTYRVQLPKQDGSSGKITNSATLYEKEKKNGKQELLEGVKAEFDYSSALHKKLETIPDAGNGYVATFTLDVDKSVPQWPEDLDTFTVQDDMGVSLTALIDSVKVYGYNAGNSSGTELPAGRYVVSYDDQDPDKNTLCVKITDTQYSRYRIRYDAKLNSSVPDVNVEMTNTAFIQGTSIRSEEIKKDVYIQTQSGSVTEVNYEVRLFKYDAENTKPLEATFNLLSYEAETGEWVTRATGLKTDSKGYCVINNQEERILDEKTWYRLVETGTPKGYISSTTYFYIGELSEPDLNEKPEGISKFSSISLKGGMHQVPNYKASLKLRKVDSAQGDRFLTGAVFELYSDTACENRIGGLTDTGNGEYSFDLSSLENGSTYYLKETQAPIGYNLPEDIVYEVTFDREGKVTVTLNGDDVEQIGNCYIIPNDSAYELPKTGGKGSIAYTTAGALLIMLGTGFLYKKKFRERRV